MKILTIKQPWAHAILHFGKDIENRNWKTGFTGRVAIHSSKVMTEDDYYNFTDFALDDRFSFKLPAKSNLVCGAILGTVEIIDCVIKSNSPWFFGHYGFVLKNPRPLKTPIFHKGARKFWRVPSEIEPLLLNDENYIDFPTSFRKV